MTQWPWADMPLPRWGVWKMCRSHRHVLETCRRFRNKSTRPEDASRGSGILGIGNKILGQGGAEDARAGQTAAEDCPGHFEFRMDCPGTAILLVRFVIGLIADRDEDDTVASGQRLKVGVRWVGPEVCPSEPGAVALEVELFPGCGNGDETDVADRAAGELDVDVFFEPLKQDAVSAAHTADKKVNVAHGPFVLGGDVRRADGGQGDVAGAVDLGHANGERVGAQAIGGGHGGGVEADEEEFARVSFLGDVFLGSQKTNDFAGGNTASGGNDDASFVRAFFLEELGDSFSDDQRGLFAEGVGTVFLVHDCVVFLDDVIIVDHREGERLAENLGEFASELFVSGAAEEQDTGLLGEFQEAGNSHEGCGLSVAVKGFGDVPGAFAGAHEDSGAVGGFAGGMPGSVVLMFRLHCGKEVNEVARNLTQNSHCDAIFRHVGASGAV